MSYGNRTGLCGLLIGSSLAIASACGGLDDVKVVITDHAGNGGDSGGDGSSGRGGAKPNGGDSSADSGAAGAIGGAGDSSAGGEAASGGEGGEVPVLDPMPGPPTVIAVAPKDGLTTADPLAPIRISFSEPLDPASVTGTNVQIKDEAGAVVDGSLTYADAVATFQPKGRLSLLGTYTVSIAAAITDAGKTPMGSPFQSSFTVRDGQWGRNESSLTTTTTGFDRLSALTLASDGVGRAVAVWGQVTGSNTTMDIYTSLFTQGKGWATPLKVNTNAVDCQYSSVAMNAAGDLIVGWIENDPAIPLQSYSIQTRRNIKGAWDKTSTRVDVASGSAYKLYLENVKVAINTNGHSHVVWTAWDYNTSTTASFNEYGVFARHADATGAWDTSVTTLSYLLPALSPGVSAPAVAFDADSNGFAAYQLASASTPTKSSTVVHRYVAATNTWGTSALGSAARDGYPQPVGVATNTTGEAVLAWGHETVVDATTSTYKLMGSHFNKAWSTPVVISSAATQLRYTKTMASATWTGKSFLVAWAQSGGSAFNVYVNEYKAAWGSATIISDGNHSAVFPWLTADGRGNALAVWFQSSDTPSTTIVIPSDVEFSRFVGSTGKWSNPARVSTGVAGYADTRAATLADGTAVATFQSTVRSIKITNVDGLFKNDFQ